MSGFAVGLNAGVNLGSVYLQAKRQEVLDERVARDDAQKQSERQRMLEMRGESDAAYKSFSNLQANGVSDGSKADFSGTAPEAEYGPVPQSQMAPVRGLREPGSDPAMPAPQVPSRAATGLEYNGAAQRIAVANRDMAAFSSLQKEGEDLSFEADFKKHYKEYVGDAAQIGETAEYINETSKTLTMGEPDAGGFVRISIIKPDKKADFVKLNRADQAKLYAGVKLMDNNPEKALKLIAGVNTNLAAAVAQENGIAFQAGKENNDTSFNRGQLRIQDAKLAAEKAQHAASLGIQRQRLSMDKLGAAKYFEDDSGNTFASVPTMTKDGLVMQTVKVNQDGLTGLRPVGQKPNREMTAVPEDGKKVKDARGNVFTYQDGEPIMKGGVPESARGGSMKALGLPPEAESELQWMPGGRHVQIGADSSTVYDVTTDKKQIQSAVAQVVQNNAAATELKARGGYAPRQSSGYPASNSPRGMQDPYNPAMQRPAVMYPKP